MSLYEKLPEKSFLKKLLVGIDSEFVEKFLTIKHKYETTEDKEEKRMFRDKMTGIFWELYRLVAKMINPELSTAKRLFLRYGLIDLRYLTPEDQELILKRPIGTVNYQTDTVFYADEWLQGILDGKIKPSAVDETNLSSESSQNTAMASHQNSGRQEKFEAILTVELNRMENFVSERQESVKKLEYIVQTLSNVYQDPDTGIEGPFSKEQLSAFEDIPNIQKEIRRLNKEIVSTARAIRKAQDALQEFDNFASSNGSPMMHNAMLSSVLSEVDNLHQMHKMTVGRQGNPFPYLNSQNIPKETKDYLYKETVIAKLNYWLEIDPEAFYRTYKGQNHNILPYFILLPGFGTTGICWEPLDRNNKQFGKGRVGLPIYTRAPDISLLSAIGDIRWQVAKEIASYYWMEEGLTGRYYEYYLEAKLKGDLKSLFVTDYILWMTKETQGVQKLEQNARYVFWRYVPMPDERKLMLSKKGYYYNQLWEKEQVWRQGQNKK